MGISYFNYRHLAEILLEVALNHEVKNICQKSDHERSSDRFTCIPKLARHVGAVKLTSTRVWRHLSEMKVFRVSPELMFLNPFSGKFCIQNVLSKSAKWSISGFFYWWPLSFMTFMPSTHQRRRKSSRARCAENSILAQVLNHAARRVSSVHAVYG